MKKKSFISSFSPLRTASRVLVVEDFEPFRIFISSLFQQEREVYVVYEASDGQEAVRRALELNPDLILMDIGLPMLNGIEAARQIREAMPKSTIVFLTQETSPEVVAQARKLGALGYIHKSRAAKDLFRAVAAVLRGEQFVSDGLCGFTIAGSPIGGSEERPPLPVQPSR